MTDVHCKGFGDFERKFKADMLKRAKEVQKAVRGAASDGATYIRNETIPVAFGELRSSVHVVGRGVDAAIVIDAPHAAAVENGSRPHWAPLVALIKWVKLRGMQGMAARADQGKMFLGRANGRMVTTRKGIARLERMKGSTTKYHALSVSGQIDAASDKGVTPIDVAEQIARAIQIAIHAHGTKPQWYARRAIPFIRQRLEARLKATLNLL